jgi:Right handed beta helix region
MLLKKGLAFGGAMLMAAVPGQSAMLHAQSTQTGTATAGSGTTLVTDALDLVAGTMTTVVGTVVSAAGSLVDAVATTLSPTSPTAPVTTVLAAPQPGTAIVASPIAPTSGAAPSGAIATSSAGPVVAKVFTVSTLAELRSALAAAQTLAGAEIRVNPGNYGDLLWNSKKYPLGRVYVVAATSTKPVFRSIEANFSENMSFHGLKVTGLQTGRGVKLNSSRNMSFTGGEVSGVTENRNPWDEGITGIQVRFSSNVVVQDNVFSDMRAAMYVQRSSNVFIRYNRLHYVREGLNIVAINQIEIRGNHFSHFYPRYDLKEHPDAIQFWTNGETVGSSKVRISENLISMGGLRAVQGVFAGSEVETARHTDWEVNRNVYYGSSPHGLSFSRIDGLKVWNNVIVASPHADVNNSVRTATTSGGYIPRLRARNSTGFYAWNNIMMASKPSTDSATSVSSYDNWDIIDSLSGVGQPWTDFFVGGRPIDEAPQLSLFLTRRPSLAFSRNGGVTTSFVYGARSLSKIDQLKEVHSLIL